MADGTSLDIGPNTAFEILTGIGLIEPYRLVGGYVNDVSEAGDDALVRTVYDEAKYERLRALKRAWDPDNVFRLNQNIRP
jgi:hypothetical protein